MTVAALEARELRVWHGPRRILDGLSLTIGRGEAVVVAGGNGAGRSTLVAALGGLVARRGEVVVGGRLVPPARPSAAVRAGLAIVPERRQVFPGLSVEDNLLLGLYTSGARTVWAARRNPALAGLYERFPVLCERRAQIAGTLSGGEQQILALGRAFVSRPEVLLLDEPFLGVAPRMADAIVAVFADFQARGGGLLVVDDHPGRMAGLATRRLVLADGRFGDLTANRRRQGRR